MSDDDCQCWCGDDGYIIILTNKCYMIINIGWWWITSFSGCWIILRHCEWWNSISTNDRCSQLLITSFDRNHYRMCGASHHLRSIVIVSGNSICFLLLKIFIIVIFLVRGKSDNHKTPVNFEQEIFLKIFSWAIKVLEFSKSLFDLEYFGSAKF